MGKFSIKDIENITGIKAHNIRIWEQRYDLMVSKRTETNIRFYDDRDLCTFLNIANLTDNGFRISEIAKMSSTEMHEKIGKLSEDHNNPCIQVNTLTEAMLEFDQEKFNLTLNKCTERTGIIDVMSETVFPFLRKVGFMWQTNLIAPAHEHFVTNLIKARLINSIESLADPEPVRAKRFLLFLPANETHEIGLCYAHYLIKLAGNRVLFLGQSVPYNDLKITAEKFNPHYCLTSITAMQSEGSILGMVDELLENLPFWPLIVSGPIISIMEMPEKERLMTLKSIQELQIFLENNSDNTLLNQKIAI